MTIVRRLARPLLAASFIERGMDALRHPGPHVEATAPLLAKVGPTLRLPDDPVLVVRASGGVIAASGVLLATGKLPRVAALGAAVGLVPTTASQHAFWEEKDPVARREQRVQFITNVSLFGAALLAAVDTEGRPGLAWRTKDAGRSAKRVGRTAAKSAKREAKRAAQQAEKSAQLAAARTERGAQRAARRAEKTAHKATKKAKDALPV